MTPIPGCWDWGTHRAGDLAWKTTQKQYSQVTRDSHWLDNGCLWSGARQGVLLGIYMRDETRMLRTDDGRLGHSRRGIQSSRSWRCTSGAMRSPNTMKDTNEEVLRRTWVGRIVTSPRTIMFGGWMMSNFLCYAVYQFPPLKDIIYQKLP